MDEARVGRVHHKIDQDSLRPGDHVYIHEHGGLTNKHGIVVCLSGKLRVVHICKKSEVVLSSSIDEFRNGKTIRLAQYDQSTVKKMFTRKGTSFTEHSRPPEEVEQTALSALLSADAQPQKCRRNCTESFALYCTTSPANRDIQNLEQLSGNDD